jgi:hypothetical protein
VRPKGIWNAFFALRVALPSTIYEESVLIGPRQKIERNLPNPGLILLHWMGCCIPSVELSCKGDMTCMRGLQNEIDFLWFDLDVFLLPPYP